MNSEEIRVAVKRLKAIPCDDTPSIFSIASALMDTDLNGSYTVIALRNRLIGLLEQANPDTHMELPKDADGEPIHIGDELEGSASVTKGERGTVHGFERNAKGVYEWIDASHVRHACKWWRHYHKPTVEDVLYKCCSEYHNAMIMGTCDIPCDVPSLSEVINKYAAKLKEAMQDDK